MLTQKSLFTFIALVAKYFKWMPTKEAQELFPESVLLKDKYYWQLKVQIQLATYSFYFLIKRVYIYDRWPYHTLETVLSDYILPDESTDRGRNKLIRKSLNPRRDPILLWLLPAFISQLIMLTVDTLGMSRWQYGHVRSLVVKFRYNGFIMTTVAQTSPYNTLYSLFL